MRKVIVAIELLHRVAKALDSMALAEYKASIAGDCDVAAERRSLLLQSAADKVDAAIAELREARSV